MRVIFTDTGLWRIDKKSGKTLVIIELRKNNGNERMHYCPTHDDCITLLEKMLEAELRNDSYEFKNPVRGNKYYKNDGKHHRPPQLNVKIKRLEQMIAEYKQENGSSKLKKKLVQQTLF